MAKKILSYENEINKHIDDKKRNDERVTQIEKQEGKYLDEIKGLEKDTKDLNDTGNSVIHKHLKF